MNEPSLPSQNLGRHEPDRPEFEHDKRGTLRSLMEAFVSLFVAVLMFRTFAAEGYMISTGSMAPSLLGYHKRVTCPTCGITFPFGTSYDTDEEPEASPVLATRSRAVCPNCGQPGIDVTDVPRNHGDQLLVNKQAYLTQAPQRWDIVVFRNPARPTEAYVKRVVGLPGERIQIVAGDVFVDGRIARKNYDEQLATRILVHDHDFQPQGDTAYEPHWIPAPLEASSNSRTSPPAWISRASAFELKSAETRRPDKAPVAWVEYHHWIRSGGQHDTTVHLDQWPEDIEPQSVPKAGLRFDPRKHEFSVIGALSAETARQLMELTDDSNFRNAVCELYELSHVVAVSDSYGYNPDEEVGTPVPVRDLIFSARVDVLRGPGEFIVELTNGSTRFSVVFDAARRDVHLYTESIPSDSSLTETSGPATEQNLTAPWPVKFGKESVIEVSIVDKQVIVAIDGKPLFDPWRFEGSAAVQPPRVPVRFGARGVDVTVRHVKLYRDIYYTDTRSRHAVNRPFELHDDEYFVLGDNSPVSHDSRRWDNPVVNKSLLVGKPFLIHLPSKPGNLRIGDRDMHLRIPDWERMRFLR